jgi:hypothetical protein
VEDRRDEGGVVLADAGLGAVEIVEEEVAVERADPTGREPLDVEVGEQDVLAPEAVVGAVAVEDRPPLVRRLVGEQRDRARQRQPGRLGLARQVGEIADVVGVVDVRGVGPRADDLGAFPLAGGCSERRSWSRLSSLRAIA